MTNKSEFICTIWVCRCCMLTHANGECCADDTHGGDSVQPWATLVPTERPTMGLLADEHTEHCKEGCCSEGDCDRDTYSTSQCQGCGSNLHGERYAFTLWAARPAVRLVKAS